MSHLNEGIVVILTFGKWAFKLLLDKIRHCVLRHQIYLLHLPGICGIDYHKFCFNFGRIKMVLFVNHDQDNAIKTIMG